MHCGSCPVPETCKKIGGCVLKMKGYNENVSRKANQVIDEVAPKKKTIIKGIPKD